MKREVWVVRLGSREAGGCNGCTAHMTPTGSAEHPVTEINLRGSSVRVCDDCLQILVKLLQKELER